MNARRSTAGFSLVEVMVAMLVLGVAIVGLTQGITSALRSNKDSEWQTTAAFLAAGQIELLRADGFIKEGVTEGKGAAELAEYEWTETVTSTPIKGLFEVAVKVKRASQTAGIYELRTLLFEPPAGSLTNRLSDGAGSSRSSRRNER
ncbi:MAG TPA: prepilin-type N-terminal cleavage/methylation domain-containing protein [Verrucomicrobiota bacterium]|nr:prepilin-type N-terminal cleavage/methylation domain-containing protein [Verrucomicrobiota bacterium]